MNCSSPQLRAAAVNTTPSPLSVTNDLSFKLWRISFVSKSTKHGLKVKKNFSDHWIQKKFPLFSLSPPLKMETR